MATQHSILNSIAQGDMVFDVGANRGAIAQDFLRVGARVVCIEPQPQLAAALRQHFINNKQVTVVEKGVGAIRGRSIMNISSEYDILSTFAEHWKVGRFKNTLWDQQVEVPITTLDDLISEFGVPRYCKIDVEGFEREVIKGLSSKIGLVSFEFTFEFIEHSMEVIEMLIRLGYRQFNVSVGDDSVFHWAEWVPYYELLRALMQATDTNLWGDIYAR